MVHGIVLPTLYIWLVVWNMNSIFPYIGNVIIPTVTHSIIFQRGCGQPPTRNIYIYILTYINHHYPYNNHQPDIYSPWDVLFIFHQPASPHHIASSDSVGTSLFPGTAVACLCAAMSSWRKNVVVRVPYISYTSGQESPGFSMVMFMGWPLTIQ